MTRSYSIAYKVPNNEAEFLGNIYTPDLNSKLGSGESFWRGRGAKLKGFQLGENKKNGPELRSLRTRCDAGSDGFESIVRSRN